MTCFWDVLWCHLSILIAFLTDNLKNRCIFCCLCMKSNKCSFTPIQQYYKVFIITRWIYLGEEQKGFQGCTVALYVLTNFLWTQNMKEKNEWIIKVVVKKRQFLLYNANSFEQWSEWITNTDHPRILTAPVCVPFDWWVLFQMFFPPSQWEFKCLVHINTKQNIRQRGPLANSLSADFITYV